MSNIQYIERMVAFVQRILVDTSTLMTPGFQQFISNNKDTLLACGKKIIVSTAVYTELVRHLESEDLFKRGSALAALELITSNKDLFQVEKTSLSEEEIAHAFADAQLLSELTLHRSTYHQLLLTNDRKLSSDAYELNQQQSCKGRKVFVCYINRFGEMQCCECARPVHEKMKEDDQPVVVDVEREPAPDDISQEAIEDTDTDWHFDLRSGIIGISGIGVLYGLFKGGKFLLRYV